MDNNEHMFEDETEQNTAVTHMEDSRTIGKAIHTEAIREVSMAIRMAIHMEILTEMPVRITETLMEAVDRITSIPTIAIHIPTGRPDRRWDQMARNWV